MFSRLVLDDDGPVIRQSGFGANGGVLRIARHDAVSGKLIGPGFKTRQPSLNAGSRVLIRIIRHDSPHARIPEQLYTVNQPAIDRTCLASRPSRILFAEIPRKKQTCCAPSAIATLPAVLAGEV